MDADARVAWLLADTAGPDLIGAERSRVFIDLGAGDNHLAVHRILTIVGDHRIALPAALLDTLHSWLDHYLGSPEEPRLRALLAAIPCA
ncbi:tryptophanase [Mycobacterium gordonae]|uniref:tryptophanase n=1 Tax=Mycobacterium gordonae TaxID=1778 RepID=UPI001E28C470|nr:tryptophanase [Mycobacterium gordonae]